jgi:uncharacterized protein YacL
MTLLFVRIFFLGIIMFVGYFIGSIYHAGNLAVVVSGLAGLLLIGIERTMKRVSVRGLSSMVFGLLLGVFMAKLVSDVISLLPLSEDLLAVLRVILTLIFSYLGAVMALRGKDEFHVIIPYVRFKRQDIGERIAILDTSAIIDGRILDVYKTHFFDDRMIVPRFVLSELQSLADSHDDLKRQRGRRGLDIIDRMKRDESVDIRIHEDDFSDETGVDAKLVRLARMIDARICTTDFNLTRVAKIQEVEILNIHELVGAVRMRLMIGDHLKASLIKEGKEYGQAVAYTPDGTMVVVADAKDKIGQSVDIEVTSVLQTQTGEMIFAKLV